MVINITKIKNKTDIAKERENEMLTKEILDCFRGKSLDSVESEVQKEEEPTITNRKELENIVANDFYTLIQFYCMDTDIKRTELDKIFNTVYGFLKDHQIDDDYYALLNTCCMSGILYAIEKGSTEISLDGLAAGLEMLSITTCIIDFLGIKQAILKEIASIKRDRKHLKVNQTKKGRIIGFKPKGD